MDKVAVYIERAVKIPFLHIADPAGTILAEAKISKVALLGTQFTMEDGFYAKRLGEKFGLEIITPELDERIQMDSIIYNELCVGRVLPKSRSDILKMIEKLQKQGADAILLGCTELGILIKPNDAEIPVYDTTLLHAKKAVELSLFQS